MPHDVAPDHRAEVFPAGCRVRIRGIRRQTERAVVGGGSGGLYEDEGHGEAERCLGSRQGFAGRQHKTKAKDGKRAQLSETYAVRVNSWLREFAGTFPATAVCDLTKEHLAAYAQTFKDFTPKTRNHRRATVKMFLKWCARQEFLLVDFTSGFAH
jgi:hypothetical protein